MPRLSLRTISYLPNLSLFATGSAFAMGGSRWRGDAVGGDDIAKQHGLGFGIHIDTGAKGAGDQAVFRNLVRHKTRRGWMANDDSRAGVSVNEIAKQNGMRFTFDANA